MKDNIIPFPNFSKRDRLEQSDDEQLHPEQIARWREGLINENPKIQWETYERMFGFLDQDVKEIILDFLEYKFGDPVLKTRCAQKLKQIFPPQENVRIEKGEKTQELSLNHIPIEIEDWKPELIVPFYTIQDYAYDNPSLIEMAQELWLYLLEKTFPFTPSLHQPKLWTAGLHYCTLRILNEEWAEHQVESILSRYELNRGELIEISGDIEQILWKV